MPPDTVMLYRKEIPLIVYYITYSVVYCLSNLKSYAMGSGLES